MRNLENQKKNDILCSTCAYAINKKCITLYDYVTKFPFPKDCPSYKEVKDHNKDEKIEDLERTIERFKIKDEIRKESKEMYDDLMNVFVEHGMKIRSLASKGRNEGKGVVHYLQGEDIKREISLGRVAGFLLWRFHLELTNGVSRSGECDTMCYNCGYPQYDNERKGWYCQWECECK